MKAGRNHLPDERPGKDSAIGIHGAQLASGEGRNHGHFPVHQVAAGFADDLLAVLGVHADRNLVAHGAGGNKQRRFAAKNLRRACFQPIHGGVFPVDVVPYLGRSHGGPHGGRGTGDGIAAQVD